MTRRLANQTRKDTYSSRRDYQELHKHNVLKLATPDLQILVFHLSTIPTHDAFLGFGGYFRTLNECEMTCRIESNGLLGEKKISLTNRWTRFGLAVDYTGETDFTVSLMFNRNPSELEIWGVNAGILNLPEAILALSPSAHVLSSNHLAPETFYLEHAHALLLDISAENSSPFQIADTESDIFLKKCSYCQRLLPVDPSFIGSLAFHKHQAKKTNHQNECRACKKWRINDDFNPRRTVDQLHESSVITRERKILLREPEILQRIKNREGDGLKSIVWKSFDKRCFKCGRQLELNDVELDHTRPLAYLWPIDEYATCLCGDCNNHKKERFPIDFYTDAELIRLSTITRLPLPELRAKEINVNQLERIIADIVDFANTWDPRTFNAIARRVLELRPDIDLFDILQDADEEAYSKLVVELAERPSSVGDEE